MSKQTKAPLATKVKPTPRQYLIGLNRPYVTLPDVARSLGVVYGTLLSRIKAMPPRERPEPGYAFRAGGSITFTLDKAIEWAERHEDWWPMNNGHTYRLLKSDKTKGGEA